MGVNLLGCMARKCARVRLKNPLSPLSLALTSRDTSHRKRSCRKSPGRYNLLVKFSSWHLLGNLERRGKRMLRSFGFLCSRGKGFYNQKPYEPKRRIRHLSELFKQGGQKGFVLLFACLKSLLFIHSDNCCAYENLPSFIGWWGWSRSKGKGGPPGNRDRKKKEKGKRVGGEKVGLLFHTPLSRFPIFFSLSLSPLRPPLL